MPAALPRQLVVGATGVPPPGIAPLMFRLTQALSRRAASTNRVTLRDLTGLGGKHRIVGLDGIPAAGIPEARRRREARRKRWRLRAVVPAMLDLEDALHEVVCDRPGEALTDDSERRGVSQTPDG